MLPVWSSPRRVWEGRSGDVCCSVVGRAGGVGTRVGGAQGADRTGVRPGRSAGDCWSLSRRRAVGGCAQNRLASGRAGGSGAALPHAVALGAQPLGRGRAARSHPRRCDRGAWRSGRRAGGRRDRVPEEGRALGRGRTPVFWHGGADRELSDWRVSGLCQPLWAGSDRPAPVPAGRLGPGRKQAGQGRRAGGDHLRDQAGDRP